MDQPLGPLAHLTRLELVDMRELEQGPPVLQRLAAAAPRLEVLSWEMEGSPEYSTAEALARHPPCLWELRLFGPHED